MPQGNNKLKKIEKKKYEKKVKQPKGKRNVIPAKSYKKIKYIQRKNKEVKLMKEIETRARSFVQSEGEPLKILDRPRFMLPKNQQK